MAHLDLDGRLAGVQVARLSAGQRRRVAIATLVARRPELWLLDEPHAGLDQAGRGVLDRLVTDAAASGATILVASHDLDRATRVATRVVMVAGGAVTASERVLAPDSVATATRSGAKSKGESNEEPVRAS
jgi:energy-coupling factor transporter ATP-binding protein EcfA2